MEDIKEKTADEIIKEASKKNREAVNFMVANRWINEEIGALLKYCAEKQKLGDE